MITLKSSTDKAYQFVRDQAIQATARGAELFKAILKNEKIRGGRAVILNRIAVSLFVSSYMKGFSDGRRRRRKK